MNGRGALAVAVGAVLGACGLLVAAMTTRPRHGGRLRASGSSREPAPARSAGWARRVLLAGLVLAVTAGVAAGSTYAWFRDASSTGTVTITTGNLDLCLSRVKPDDVNYRDWICGTEASAEQLGLAFPTGIYPGYENLSVGSLWLTNQSDSPVPLDVTLAVNASSVAPEGLGNVIDLGATWDGGGTDWRSLTGDSSWVGYQAPLFGAPLAQGGEQLVTFQVRMSGEADDVYAGGAVTLSLCFDAVQHHE